jgi:hypothetical protein
MNPGSRRMDEDMKHDIEKMIIEEADPKEKVRLLVLMQLNSSLVDNVVAVRTLTAEFKSHRIEFEDHVHKEEKLMAAGRGAMWGVLILMGCIQALSGYIFTQHMKAFDRVEQVAQEANSLAKLQDQRFNDLLNKIEKAIEK